MNKTITVNVLFGLLATLSTLSSPAQCPTDTPVINNAPALYYSQPNSAYSIPCGSSTADLSGLTGANQPANAQLTWHSATPATTANKFNTLTGITGGTHKVYASYYNAGSNCYGPAKEITIYAPVCPADDDYSATPVIQGVATTLPSLYANDTYNGQGFTGPDGNVGFGYELWQTIYATVNPDGTINVLPNTPPGTYNFLYRIVDLDKDAVTGSNYNVAMVTIVVIGQPLPLTVVDFTARQQGDAAKLSWNTVDERENAGFTIERSADGKSWAAAGFVSSGAANNNPGGKIAYTFTDDDVRDGENYYRLKQTDVNGKSAYSATVKVVFTKTQHLNVYPNPSRGAVTIDGLEAGETIRVYDVTGRVLITEKAGTPFVQISLEPYPDGIYQICVLSETGAVETHKIWKAD